jgi:hypothetical protein
MAATVTITAQRKNDIYLAVEGTIAFTGSYSTGGETLTFPGLRTQKTTPVNIDIEGQLGYLYQYVYSTGKLKIITAAAQTGTNPAPIEHTAAAYASDTNPATGPTADVVTFLALFRTP